MLLNSTTLKFLAYLNLALPILMGAASFFCLIYFENEDKRQQVAHRLGIATIVASGVSLAASTTMAVASPGLFHLSSTVGIPVLLCFLAIVTIALDSYLLYLRVRQHVVSRLGYWGVGILVLLDIVLLINLKMAHPVIPLANYSVNIVFYIDSLSLFFILLVNLVAFVVSWNDIAYLEHVKPERSEVLRQPIMFHALVNLFHFTMVLVPMVDNLVALWIAIELTTLFSAILVAFQNRRESWEAAWKYLIITSTGIILALLGTMFLAKALPIALFSSNQASDTLMNWSNLVKLAQTNQLEPEFVKLAFLFALVGYGTKAGLAPMHTWLPDGHGEAPAPISALLSGVLLKSAFYAILRFYILTNLRLGDNTFTSGFLLGIGLLSLLLAVPFILKENIFKRVLAYHSLEHMGIITFGLGLGGPIAIFGVLLHSLNHALTKSLMFLSFGNIIRNYEQAAIQDGYDYKQDKITGILRSMPVTGGILTLGGLALVGTPPFNIFMSELIILWGGLNRLVHPEMTANPAARTANYLPNLPGWIVYAAIGLFILSTTLIYYGLVHHLGKHVLHKMPGDRRLPERFWKDLVPIILLSGAVLLLGIWIIPPLANLINAGVSIILEGPPL
jgi:hydrogenase-4 component F